MWQELEDTIGSLKSQISSLQQRCAILQDELDYRETKFHAAAAAAAMRIDNYSNVSDKSNSRVSPAGEVMAS